MNINPIIFSFKVGSITIALRWYGVLVMLGVLAGSWFAEREIRRRGENGDRIWDALVYVLIPGIIGARLWYVANSILGGNHSYLDDPASILRIWEGGLHFFGGLLFGGIALFYYARSVHLDLWLLLDSVAPAALIGQAVARPANFINQELYGPPTKLPWGIPIQAEHRLPQFPISQYPVETTRFHPTFAYELILNLIAASLLLWLARKYADRIKPGTIFGGWLISAGIIRVFIEFYRPDQPLIPGAGFTYSALVSALMAIAGAIILMIRYKAINFAFAENWEEEYQVAGMQPVSAAGVEMEEETDEVESEKEEVEEVVEEKKPRAVRAKAITAKPRTTKKPIAKPAARKTSTARKPAAKKSTSQRTTKK